MLLATVYKVAGLFAQILVVIIERRYVAKPNQFTSHFGRFDFEFAFDFFADLFDKVFGKDDILIEFRIVDRCVFDFFVDRSELIAWQSPRRRCPDQQARILAIEQREQDVD